MQDITNIPLVVSEISGLWKSYMGNNLSACVLKYFVNRATDTETISLLQYTIDLSNQHLQVLTDFLNKEGLPLPEGLKDEDVDVNAPRLFTDEFYLLYLSNMARIEMLSYSQILGNCVRSDIRNFFTKLVGESSDLYNKVTNLRLSKGILIRFPSVEVPKTVQYVKKENFILDWFGEKRPLVVSEIASISTVILANILGRALTTGFGQVSKTKEITLYMFRGRDISSKKIDIFSSILTGENIPLPSTPSSYVTSSTVSPFSEKLMLYHIISLGTVSITNDGSAIGDTLRADLQLKFMRILPEVLKYVEDGANIMINNGWFEQPPQSVEHKKLVGFRV